MDLVRYINENIINDCSIFESSSASDRGTGLSVSVVIGNRNGKRDAIVTVSMRFDDMYANMKAANSSGFMRELKGAVSSARGNVKDYEFIEGKHGKLIMLWSSTGTDAIRRVLAIYNDVSILGFNKYGIDRVKLTQEDIARTAKLAIDMELKKQLQQDVLDIFLVKRLFNALYRLGADSRGVLRDALDDLESDIISARKKYKSGLKRLILKAI